MYTATNALSQLRKKGDDAPELIDSPFDSV